MILKTTGYKSSDGAIHGSLELAQAAELKELFTGKDRAMDLGAAEWSIDEIVNHIMENSEKVLDVLTMTPKSKPRARKINGGTKTRAKKSTRHEAEQFALPMEDSPKPAA